MTLAIFPAPESAETRLSWMTGRHLSHATATREHGSMLMDAEAFDISPSMGGRWITIAGDLSYQTVGAVRAELQSLMSASGEPVVLDLRDVHMFTSTAIELLLDLSRPDAERSIVLLLNEQVEQILTIAGVDRRFTTTRDEAVARSLADLEG